MEGYIPQTPINIELTQEGVTAVLSWEADGGYDSFNVYRSINGADFELLTNTSELTINDDTNETATRAYKIGSVFDDTESELSAPYYLASTYKTRVPVKAVLW